MKIRLTRIDNDTHRLEIERADGSRLATNLETRSVLLHDLVHFAVETEAGIPDGVWGSLADGLDFEALRTEVEAPTRPGIALAETLVGPMQSVFRHGHDADRYVERMKDVAPFVDRAFVERVLERIRRLWGHWQGTPFRRAMELDWPRD
ncbi:MAG: hypothetical protein KDB80_15815 [Planctomycetes bacterium]|nr:hypothetical protein [Planctomycetota bacterium]